MLTGSEINYAIPGLSYSKDISGIEYKPFTNYKSDLLPLLSTVYLHTLEDIPTQYAIHNDNKCTVLLNSGQFTKRIMR